MHMLCHCHFILVSDAFIACHTKLSLFTLLFLQWYAFGDIPFREENI